MVSLIETITDEEGEEKDIDVLCPSQSLAVFGTDRSRMQFYDLYTNELITRAEESSIYFRSMDGT